MSNPNDVTIGCADTYDAIITARDLTTYAARLDWSSITWSRVLDEISEASVVVPDVFGGLRCNIELGTTLVPWRFGLRIERNGELVWSGPIVSVERPQRDGMSADSVTVTANDALAWTTRRTTNDFLDFTDADAGAVFKSVLDAGMVADNLPGLNCPDFTTGYTMTRQVLPLDFEYTFDILTELANSAVDYFMINNELAVFDIGDLGWFVLRDGVKRRLMPSADPFGRYIYGLFTDAAYDSRPGYLIDGFSQGNNILIPGADSGEAGFRRYWQASDVDLLDGLLTYVHVSSLYRPQSDGIIVDDAVFQQLADSNLAMRARPVVTLSGGQLSQSAPVKITDLLPGSLWAIDLADMGIAYLVDVQRLKRVDVSVSADNGGIIETVSPTLIPIGSDETVVG